MYLKRLSAEGHGLNRSFLDKVLHNIVTKESCLAQKVFISLTAGLITKNKTRVLAHFLPLSY